MIFNSIDFLLFFPTIYAIYLFSNRKAQNIFLLVASYFFYGYWDYRYLSLLFISTVVDYIASLGIERNSENVFKKKLYLTLSILCNLGILGFFKYYNFFISSAADALSVLGLHTNPVLLKFALPLGISFYTFQTMSYSIDVYRGQLKPTKNFLDFALFVSFFPQLVAGPIERATRLLPQVLEDRKITMAMLKQGGFLVLLGFFKKIYVADNLSYIIDPVFVAESPSGFQILTATYAFMFQIYCDFSGYSDIARGISKFMGFELMLNFRQPILSVNIIEVWKSWHISLTSWLRDYLYIPLGGNKVSEFRQHINNIIIFFASGLWHGAAWTYIFWGVYNGILTSLHKIIHPYIPVLPGDNIKVVYVFKTTVKIVFTASLFGFSGMFFRCQNLEQIFHFLSNIVFAFGSFDGDMMVKFVRLVLVLLLIEIHQYANKDEFSIFKLHTSLRVAIYFVVFYSIIILGNFNKNEFIYFVF
ncbi:MAG: MBOAT family protein [Leptospiraceae bacterium]|nr:MBOAT family protein [Leptospiraceae bacterium]MCP5494842.1 MBOAT family protein [Leptospiraceae bacterium]